METKQPYRVHLPIQVGKITFEPGPGIGVHLTPTEAAQYGDAVSADLESPVRDSQKARIAGEYVVVAPDLGYTIPSCGGVYQGGRTYHPGEHIRLGRDEAVRLGDLIAFVGP